MMFAKFLLVGVVNTLVGLAAIYAAMYFLGFDTVAANALGYGVGILVSFLLNKQWTFANSDQAIPTLLRFLLVIGLAYAVNLAVVVAADYHFGLDKYLAQAMGLVPYTLTAFLGSRYYAFKARRPAIPVLAVTGEANSPIQPRYPVPVVSLGVVVPCYNEEEVLSETWARLERLLVSLISKGIISTTSRIYFVDDGSRDKTWHIIEQFAAQNPLVKGIKLSRNRGHQNALLAGLLTAEGDVLVSIDADLQDDLGAIESMLQAHRAGYDIVYGARSSRDTDTYFKRLTARSFYHLMRVMGVDIVFDHADFRLMNRPVLEALRDFSEVNLFLRGIIPQLGYKSTVVYYNRAERFAGESKYPLGKMLAFAWQGITSFSAAPLRFITGLGFIVSAGSFIVTLWGLWVRFFTNQALPGWASTVLPIYFLGGIQLLCLGIIGEYLAKIYLEAKRRPRFVIEKIV
jgi:glycosyltransferase involved in cell wall biosynthesis/putative flippase GtrA